MHQARWVSQISFQIACRLFVFYENWKPLQICKFFWHKDCISSGAGRNKICPPEVTSKSSPNVFVFWLGFLWSHCRCLANFWPGIELFVFIFVVTIKFMVQTFILFLHESLRRYQWWNHVVHFLNFPILQMMKVKGKKCIVGYNWSSQSWQSA